METMNWRGFHYTPRGSLDRAQDHIYRVYGRWNPEDDAGKVNWADVELTEAIAELIERVSHLERELAALKEA